MAFIYDLSDTWNNAGISFNGIKLNATDTASAAGSKLLDLQISGASKFTVGKTGTVIATGLIESTIGGFKFPDGTTQTTKATVNSVSGTGTVSGLTLTGTVTNSGSLTLGGTLVLTSGQVTTALGFTPYNATNPSGYLSTVSLTSNVTGILPIANGGTNANTAAGARTSLGLGTAAVLNAGVAGGVATLDGSGTVPTSQLPGAVLGGLNYQGTWNASTNTPTLASSTGSKGYYYVVSVAGSTNLNGVTDWKIGDWAVYDGTAWQKVDNTDAVSSVNGYTGAVVLSTSDVAQGTNLYFTQAAARGSVSAGTGISYDSGTGVITNSAPDQTVALTGAGTTVVTGTYPNFTITSNDSTVGTVTSVAASGGTTGLSFTGSPITTSGTLTLAGTLGVANGGTGTATAFTAGSVVFAGASGVYSQDNANLFWDNTNDRLGIGIAAPLYKLHVASTSGYVSAFRGTTAATTGILVGNTVGDTSVQTLASGDGFIFSDTSKYLAFGSSNTERMRITSAGNVGIGTTAPAGKLEVASTDAITTLFVDTENVGVSSGNYSQVALADTGTIRTWWRNVRDGSGKTAFGYNNHLAFLSDAGGTPTERMRIDSAGRLLVGTTTGVGTDFVSIRFNSAGSYPQGLNMVDSNASANGTYYQVFRKSDDTNIGLIRRSGTDNAIFVGGNSYLALGSGDTERMRIDASGNVGIGTSSMAAKFVVSNGGAVGIELDPINGFISSYNRSTSAWTKMTTRASSYTFNIANSNDAVNITAAGNVGIGTTTPSEKLSVAGNIAVGFDLASANTVLKSFTTGHAVANRGATIGFGMYDSVFAGMKLWNEAAANASFNRQYITFDTHEGAFSSGERMRIDGYGNVGIGTATPGSKFDVLGVFRLQQSANAVDVLGKSDNTGALNLFGGGAFNAGAGVLIDGQSSASANTIRFTRGAFSESMRITSVGDVAIGTSSPGTKFHTVGGNVWSSNFFEVGRFQKASGTGVTLGYDNSAYVATIGAYSHDGTASNLAFWTYPGSGSATERMRIDSGGNVGIGTSSVGARLDITSGTAFSMRITGPANVYQDITDGTGTLRMQLLSNAPYLASIGAYPFILATNNTERMRIDASGNVGIGATDPISYAGYGNLTLQGTNGGTLTLRNTANTASGEMASAAGAVYLKTVAATPLWFGTNNTERMRIDSSGNVGIGTSSPSNKLQSSYTVSASLPAAGATGHGLAVGSSGFGLTAGALNTGNGYLQATRWDGIATNYDLLLQPNGGNVGIGTASPQQKFVVSNAGAGGIEIVPTGVIQSYNRSGGAYQALNYDASIHAFRIGVSEAMRIDASGNVLVGTTSSDGVASNTARVIGGVFSTLRSSASIAHNTATTIATLPSGEGNYIVSASLNASSSPSNYNEVAVVGVSGSTTIITVLVNAGALSLSMSGLNLQVTQGQGSTQTVQYSVLRIL